MGLVCHERQLINVDVVRQYVSIFFKKAINYGEVYIIINVINIAWSHGFHSKEKCYLENYQCINVLPFVLVDLILQVPPTIKKQMIKSKIEGQISTHNGLLLGLSAKANKLSFLLHLYSCSRRPRITLIKKKSKERKHNEYYICES